VGQFNQMTTAFPGQFISYEELSARCETKGIDIENNGILATRLPPGLSCGMSPEGYTNAKQLTAKDSAFVMGLGDPAPRLKFAFDAAAPNTQKFTLDISAPKFGNN
jgi:hypothetical protein